MSLLTSPSSLVRDLSFATRLLLTRPGFSVVAILTLALGIGANTAIYSVVQGVLWGSVPFDAPQELVFLGEHSEQVPNMSVSWPNFQDWEARNESFDAIAAHRYRSFNVTGLEKPEVLVAVQCSASLFPLLRVQPFLGRAFSKDEDRIGGERVTLVSYEFWETRLGSDPAAIGRTLSLDGEPFEILGVLPRGFLYPISSFPPDLWMPIAQFSEPWLERRGSHPGIYVTGRVTNGVTLERAEADMASLAKALEQEYPDSNTGNGINFSPLTERVVRNIRPALLVLSCAVVLVLLIACVNVANLLLARSMGRQREIAVRAAMGSGRWQLMRQLLTEAIVLALASGAAGVAVALVSLKLLNVAAQDSLRMFGEIGIDYRVLMFALLLSAATGFGFGLFPAIQLLKSDFMSGLKDGGRGNSAGQSTLGSSLVVAQVAFALLLLVGALLFIQSFHRLSTADAGFDPTGVLTLSINLPDGRYPEVQQQQLFFEQLLERVKALPGVDKAATMLPLLGGWQNTVMAEGQDPPRPGQEISTDITRVSPDYFQTMGISLLKGRVFDERDREGALPVAIVDRTFAEFFWPGTDALGKRVRFSTDPDSDDPWLEIVGISEHVKHYGVAADSRIEIYVPMAQDPRGFVTLAVRTSSDPRSLANSIENEVLALDANQPVNRVRTLDEITAATTSPQRLAASLLGVFSALALLLAAIGIYGVMAYTVSQQRHEIGIRMALGASANTVLKMIVFRGLKLAGTGVAIGLTLSLIATPLVASQLFGIEARDPVTFASLPAVLVIVAVLACAIPAIRASRTPPVVVLRYE